MGDLLPKGVMLGIGDVTINEADLGRVTMLAAGAIAFMSAIGNDTPELAMRALHAVAMEHSRLTPATGKALGLLSHEVLGAAQAGKMFALMGTVGISPSGATPPAPGGWQGSPGHGETPDAALAREGLLQRIAEVAFSPEGELLSICDLLRDAGIRRSA